MSRPFDPYRDVVGSRDLLVVSASAGTGKTWMITHLAARWLLEEDREPGELLMVTFSRAAAGELKGRLRSRLRELADALEGGGPDVDDPIEWRRGLAESVARVGVEVMRARARTALARLDDVHARTIHSFACALRFEDERSLADGDDLRRRAAQETVTAAALGRPEVAALLLRSEDDERVTPSARTLANGLTSALAAADGVGGLSSRLWSTRRDPNGDLRDDELALLEELLAEGSRRLARLRQLESQATFDSIIGEVHAEVTRGASPAADRARRQFGLVLVDEFQDTDALQWEILRAIFLDGSPRVPVVVVGDAKQAIYGFRGGDVTVFERARAVCEDDQTLELTTSHRSAEGLLGGLNGLFLAGAAHGWRLDERDPSHASAYRALSPSTRLVGVPGALELRVTTRDARDDDLVAVVSELVGDRSVAPGDVAVLCRSRAAVGRIRRRLDRAGMPAAALGGDSVLASVAAAHLRALLVALADTRDPARNRLVAATWFDDLTPDDLPHLAERVSTRGVAALAGGVLGPAATARLLTVPEGERHLTDLEHLVELLAAATRGPAEPTDLLRLLDEWTTGDAEGNDLEDRTRRRIESDGDAVQVMTIHSAKGLEFPVVLIPEIESNRRRRPGATSFLTAHGRTLETATLLGRDPSGEEAETAERSEARRLIYVALTRATRLTVAWHTDSGTFADLVGAASDDAVGRCDGGGAPVAPPARSIAGQPLASAHTLDLVVRTPRVLERPRLVGPAPTPDRRRRRWSYSSLVLPEAALADDDAVDLDDASTAEAPTTAISPVPILGGLAGARLGNAVHRVLERVVGDGEAGHADLGELVSQAFGDEGLGTPGPEVAGDVVRLLERPLGRLIEDASLGELGRAGATAREMRFTLALSTGGPAPVDRLRRLCALVADGDPAGPFTDFFTALSDDPRLDGQLLVGHLVGSIDLVARTASGRYVVVDYKTNQPTRTTGYEPAELAVEMAASGYPLQGLLYAVALHRHLRGRLVDYEPARDLGGLLYLYVRGVLEPATPRSGLMEWALPGELVARCSDLLDSRVP